MSSNKAKPFAWLAAFLILNLGAAIIAVLLAGRYEATEWAPYLGVLTLNGCYALFLAGKLIYTSIRPGQEGRA